MPESVTVISGQVIHDARILDLRDASYRAPNVIFSTSPHRANRSRSSAASAPGRTRRR